MSLSQPKLTKDKNHKGREGGGGVVHAKKGMKNIYIDICSIVQPYN